MRGKAMNEFNFSVPQNIIVGRGSMAKLPEVAKKMGGKHAFIISGPHLKKMGLVEKAAESLRAEGILVDDFTDIEGNPSVTTVEAATEAFQASGADFIVAFGGGSPMDVAKAVGVVAKYGGSITEYEGGVFARSSCMFIGSIFSNQFPMLSPPIIFLKQSVASETDTCIFINNAHNEFTMICTIFSDAHLRQYINHSIQLLKM